VVADCLLDLGVAGQRAQFGHAESLCGLGLGEAEIFDALLDDYARGLLREHLPGAVVTVALPGHQNSVSSCSSSSSINSALLKISG
jgi:hypothetical protein